MRRAAPLILTALLLAACGKSPTAANKPVRDNLNTPATTSQPTAVAPVAGAPGSIDPRVANTMALVEKLHLTSTTADSTLMFHYFPPGAATAWLKCEYKFQMPRRNAITLLDGSEAKATGSQLVWTGDGQVQVHTKFIGFWLTLGVDMGDDRLKDPDGYKLNETAIDKVFNLLLCPSNTITYLADGNLNGHAMDVVTVVSPLSLKPTTHEVFGIDKVSGTPLLREMYNGTKCFYRLEVQSFRVNPKLTTTDFTVS